MKRADLGDVFFYDGELVQLVATTDHRTLTLRPIGKERCPTCGSKGDIHVVESSRLFQEKAEPVPTLREAGS